MIKWLAGGQNGPQDSGLTRQLGRHAYSQAPRPQTSEPGAGQCFVKLCRWSDARLGLKTPGLRELQSPLHQRPLSSPCHQLHWMASLKPSHSSAALEQPRFHDPLSVPPPPLLSRRTEFNQVDRWILLRRADGPSRRGVIDSPLISGKGMAPL